MAGGKLERSLSPCSRREKSLGFMDDGGVARHSVKSTCAPCATTALWDRARHGAIRRFLLGSAAAKVIHDVNCPVWAGIHFETPEHEPRAGHGSILRAVSLDEEIPRVLRFAAGLAASFSVIHLVETPPMAWDVAFGPDLKNLIDAAETDLKMLCGEQGVEASLRRAPVESGRGCIRSSRRLLAQSLSYKPPAETNWVDILSPIVDSLHLALQRLRTRSPASE